MHARACNSKCESCICIYQCARVPRAIVHVGHVCMCACVYVCTWECAAHSVSLCLANTAHELVAGLAVHLLVVVTRVIVTSVGLPVIGHNCCSKQGTRMKNEKE